VLFDVSKKLLTAFLPLVGPIRNSCLEYFYPAGALTFFLCKPCGSERYTVFKMHVFGSRLAYAEKVFMVLVFSS
jgi:hypothetical protein